jgi:hypothetical protein
MAKATGARRGRATGLEAPVVNAAPAGSVQSGRCLKALHISRALMRARGPPPGCNLAEPRLFEQRQGVFLEVQHAHLIDRP